MKVATGFGGESSNNLTIDSILQTESETSGCFVRTSFVGLGTRNFGEKLLGGCQRIQIGEPTKKMRVLIVFEQTDNLDIP